MIRRLLTFTYLLSCLGCGYAPLRTAGALGVERVLVVAPREAEPTGIAGPYVEQLRRRLAAEGFSLARSAPNADATLTGEVIASSTSPLGTVPGAQLTAFNVRVTLEAQLQSRSGELLWTGRFSEAEDFRPEANDAPGLLATEANRRRALARLTERLAARVVRSLQRASS